jgi:UDP-N-acetylmuramyl pentapeptide synthase
MADRGGMPLEVHTAHDSSAAAAALRRVIRRGDVLLVKGSRALAMELVIDNLSAT